MPDLPVELIAGSVTTILGAALGYYAGHVKDANERKSRREVLATALLVELRWLNSILRQVAAKGVPVGDPFDHPVLEGTMGELSLFDRDTAREIVRFRSMLLDVRNDARTARQVQESETGMQGTFYTLDASVKSKAVYTANAIKDLKEALVRCGGDLPPPIQEQATLAASPPALLPSPFALFGPEDETNR